MTILVFRYGQRKDDSFSPLPYLPKYLHGAPQVQEQLRIFIRTQTSPGTMSDPIFTVQGLFRSWCGTIYQLSDQNVVGLLGCHRFFGVRWFLVFQLFLELQVSQPQAELTYGGNYIRSYNDTVHSKIIFCSGRSMQDPHLLEDGRFSRLSGTQQQQLHLELFLLSCSVELSVNGI